MSMVANNENIISSNTSVTVVNESGKSYVSFFEEMEQGRLLSRENALEILSVRLRKVCFFCESVFRGYVEKESIKFLESMKSQQDSSFE